MMMDMMDEDMMDAAHGEGTRTDMMDGEDMMDEDR